MQQGQQHTVITYYEYDRDRPNLRSRISECVACRMPWPCPTEIARAIVAAIGRES